MNNIIQKSALFAGAIMLTACVTTEEESNKHHAHKPETDAVELKEIVATAEYEKQKIRVTGARLKQRANTPMLAMAASPGALHHPYIMHNQDIAGENYAQHELNAVFSVLETPVSTFSIDVDTGSYSNLRRILQQGDLPPKGAVRTEELLNYFSYDYQAPSDLEQPFLVNSSMMIAPWDSDKHLLQIGIKAWEPEKQTQRPSANLVFLVDVSGSMAAPDKLPLLKKSLLMLSKQMRTEDKISIVVYAGASGVVLEPTSGNNYLAIEQALSKLRSGGSTNGEAGIKLAYQMAEKAFIQDGINRIMIATDGDFNVGQTSLESLISLIELKREKGIALSTLGFGRGNYNDQMMEQLANKGNGSYSYIDNLLEARKVLVEELDSQLITVAADVKLQLEFNPQYVAEYRLVGYENRVLNREDFNNDKVDAGEIGAGHTVTAIYEISLNDSKSRSLEPLRYQKADQAHQNFSDELAFMRIRYKQPGEKTSQLIEQPLDHNTLLNSANQPNIDSQFSAAIIALADQLQGGKYIQNFSYNDIANLALKGRGKDERGIRAEFARLVRLAEALKLGS